MMMEELGSIWDYEENVDELNQKLLYRTLELESLKMEAAEEIRKSKESVKNLLDLLKMAYNERDEARNQLRMLMDKLICSNPRQLQTRLPHLHSEIPLFIPTKANSSITESNSLSHNSPVDSFFETVPSPDFSNINMADSSKMGIVNQRFLIDPSLERIERIVKGKPLPEKGKLLQSVMEASPLLQILLVTGPLPRWRNPPSLEPFKIPPLSIKGSEIVNFYQNPFPKSSFSGQKQQICSASMLSFNGGPSGSCFNIPDSKRRRFQ